MGNQVFLKKRMRKISGPKLEKMKKFFGKCFLKKGK
jgi:hypothetical protein